MEHLVDEAEHGWGRVDETAALDPLDVGRGHGSRHEVVTSANAGGGLAGDEHRWRPWRSRRPSGTLVHSEDELAVAEFVPAVAVRDGLLVAPGEQLLAGGRAQEVEV